MSVDLISIQEAADLSQKSIQTIRRAIKAKKLKVKKNKTPQGFNYLISQKAVLELYKVKIPVTKKPKKAKSTSRATSQPTSQNSAQTPSANSADLVEFNKTLQQLIREHSQERQNYLRLIQAMQEKMVALENQFNLLKSADEKSWYQFWK